MNSKALKAFICEECNISKINVFKNLTKEELDKLNFEKKCSTYKRGSLLYHEGNHINGFYCMFKGIVKLYKTGIEGKEQIIRFAIPGDIMGFRSILTQELACTSAKAIEDSTLCFIPAQVLHYLVRNNPSFSMDLLQTTCKELGEANRFILDISQKTVKERLAEILLLLKDTFELDKESNLRIVLTREELANMVGTATESVIRLLSEFKTQKIVDLVGRKIQILDIKKLQYIATFK